VFLPDLPLAEFEREYKQLFGQYDLSNIFLVTPQTSFDRIRQIDLLSDTFIYVVSSSSITGAKQGISEEQITYLERIRDMELQHATLVGFGVSESETFSTISRYASGSIVGSAFIKMLSESVDLRGDIVNFVKSIKQGTKA
ncbi:MAG: tryptophan synthase subunit alpha, partial [Cyclobacteriaceae bacterium]|nr:tryptophan synthase subunit alpha [Cyclobacteriaceae bacterium]